MTAGRPPKTTVDVTWRRPRKGRDVYTLHWRDPITRQERSQQAESTTRDELDREAARLEIKLRGEFGLRPVNWEDFAAIIREQFIAKKAKGTQAIYRRTIDLWEEANGFMPNIAIIGPVEIARFQKAAAAKKNRDGNPVEETTVAKDLRHLKGILNWGVRGGFIAKIAHVEMPKRKRGFQGKGTPISELTYRKFCKAVEGTVGAEHAPSWQVALDGLWHSAFRISELLAFTWDRLEIKKSGAVVIHWGCGDQKSRRAETTPTCPEFGELVKGLPYRDGLVFRPMLSRGIVHPCTFSDKIKEICDTLNIKFTAHDLRRTFADRWARRVTPLVLSRLMRCSVSVIQGYYAELESESISLELIKTSGRRKSG